MQLHRSIEKLPPFKNAVVTIGTFDGVHHGHQKIIAALKQEGQRVDGETIIITFHPHPRKIVQPTKTLQLINTPDEKILLLEKSGIDHLVIVPFTASFSEQSPDDYIKNFLIQNFHPASIIIGYDHHFGKDRAGNYKLLEAKQSEYNYHLIEIPKQVLDEIAISSTKIRNAILQSEIDTANKLLGYSFFFEGEVVTGDKLGRTLGYPTANIEYIDEDKIHLGHGVYAVYVEINGKQRKGMLSIGTRPTLNDPAEKVEVNIFDFDEDLYQQKIKITVEYFLRRQEKYSSLEAMIEQLHKDKQQTLELFS